MVQMSTSGQNVTSSFTTEVVLSLGGHTKRSGAMIQEVNVVVVDVVVDVVLDVVDVVVVVVVVVVTVLPVVLSKNNKNR